MAKLLLLPNLLDEELPYEPFLPASVPVAIASIRGIIAESEKAARRYLRKFLPHEVFSKMPIALLNEHTSDLAALLRPIEEGETWGLISDAGLPCVADPGSDLVWLARRKGIAVQTFVGPSSILLALQLSGLCGQRFAFHGYLPREIPDLEKRLKELEKKEGTQIWIEAPYRSAKMLSTLIAILQPTTRLCVAVQLTTPQERVVSQTIADWKRNSLTLEKEPAVFLLDSHPPVLNKGV